MTTEETARALREAGERLDRAAIEMQEAREELIDAAAEYALCSQAHRVAIAESEAAS